MSSASPAKKRASSGKPKKAAASHPTYQQMVKMSIQSLKDPKGSSKAKILKYIVQTYKVGNNIKQINSHLNQALRRGVTKGLLKQVKGTGASGSFRLGESAKRASPKKVKKTKKATPKKAKKTTATGEAKKTVAKKTKSPKKAKSPKKPKSPKAKKPKSPKAKKSPAKKAAKKASPKKAAKKSPKKASKKAAPKKA